MSDSATAADSSSATLDLHRAYQPGDRILFSGPQEMAVRMDQSLPECLIYAPKPSSGKLVYEIPYGRAEQETGSAYAPEGFTGDSHRVTVRALTGQERHGYRNLALNPCDQPRPTLRSTLMQPPTAWHAISSTSRLEMRSMGRPATAIMARGPISPGAGVGSRCVVEGGLWPARYRGQGSPDASRRLPPRRHLEERRRGVLRWKPHRHSATTGRRVSGVFFSASKDHLATSDESCSCGPGKWCALIELEAWGSE